MVSGSGSSSKLGGCPFSELNYSEDDVAAFRKIPTRTHHGMRLASFKATFSGKEAVAFLKKQKSCNRSEAKAYGDLMLQGGVFAAVNFRLEKRFSDSHRTLYRFEDASSQNLFWLTEEARELLAVEKRRSLVHEEAGSDTSDALRELKSIPPLPLSVPIFGNAIFVANPMDMNRSMMNMSRNLCPKYGPLFRINLVGQQYAVVSEPQMLKTIFESASFGKFVEKDAIFCELKQFRGEGLTTISDGALHGQCQAIIAPLLMRRVLENYLPTVIETVNSSIMELEKSSMKRPVDMRKFWKRCILRTVGKVAISEDLYSGASKWKQFCKNITFVAEEAIDRVFKGSKLMPMRRYNFAKAVKQLHVTLMDVIAERKAYHERINKDPKDYDLLDVMLKTPISKSETGVDIFMSDELIRANLTTILSAGHSTTTSMLSWACNFLYDFSLGNHDCLNAILLEVEKISGGDRRYVPTIDDVYEMKYITNVLKETLRLQPPIPTILRMAKQTTDLGGFRVPGGTTMMISILGTHLNAEYWPEPTKFKPERFNTLPEPYTFLPWAGGERQCIGREFALLTGRVAMFLIHNQLNLNMDPSARVEEIEHLFVFPSGLKMRGIRRRSTVGSLSGISPSRSSNDIVDSAAPDSTGVAPQQKSRNGSRQWEGLRQLVRSEGYRVVVAKGTKSPQGSTQMVAEQLYGAAIEFHFKCGEGAVSLNEVAKEFSAAKPSQHTTLAIVISTYQGNPAPDAKAFFSWVMDMKNKASAGDVDATSYLENVAFFVFGCGNDSWAATYQKVAIQLDEALPMLGAKRICVRGEYNEACDDLETVFEEYYKTMAPALMHSLPAIGEKRLRAVDKSLGGKDAPDEPKKSSPPLQLGAVIEAQHASSAVQMVTLGFVDEMPEKPQLVPSTVTGDRKIYACEVVKNINIQSSTSDRETHHIEFKLEDGMKYEAGDHLVICPENSEDEALKVLAFTPDYDLDTVVLWKNYVETRTRFNFPLNVPLTVRNVLCHLVDLRASPKKQFLANLATIVGDEQHAAELRRIVADQLGMRRWIEERQPYTVLDALAEFPIADTQFGRLLEILPPMRTRPYSIASSPKLQSQTVHLCVGLNQTDYPDKDPFFGLCSSFLSGIDAGAGRKVHVYVEEADEHFRVPSNDKPVLLVSAGTGYAPMRSFVQERTARGAQGNYVFFGCRSEDTDYIYADEFEEATSKQHINGLYVAFSRSSSQPKRYVQQALLEEADLVWKALDSDGGHIYVCGCGSRVGVGVTNALKEIVKLKTGNDDAFAEAYIEDLQNAHRYELDVWG